MRGSCSAPLRHSHVSADRLKRARVRSSDVSHRVKCGFSSNEWSWGAEIEPQNEDGWCWWVLGGSPWNASAEFGIVHKWHTPNGGFPNEIDCSAGWRDYHGFQHSNIDPLLFNVRKLSTQPLRRSAFQRIYIFVSSSWRKRRHWELPMEGSTRCFKVKLRLYAVEPPVNITKLMTGCSVCMNICICLLTHPCNTAVQLAGFPAHIRVIHLFSLESYH